MSLERLLWSLAEAELSSGPGLRLPEKCGVFSQGDPQCQAVLPP